MRFLRLNDRPQPVRWAIWLLLGSNVVSLLLSLVRAFVSSAAETVTTFLFVGLAAIVSLGLVLAIALGRRWAFVLYLLLFFGGLASLGSNLGVNLGQGLLVFTWYALSFVLDAVGIALLLMPSAREWFGAPKAARRDGVPAS